MTPKLSTETDVLIVGGGPAGLKAAETTASAGLKTMVVEREREIGEPVHTSGATAVETMKEFRIPPEYYHPITRLRLCSPNASAVFCSREAFGCVIDVKGTYKLLAHRAETAGATIMTSTEGLEPIVRDSAVIGCVLKSGETRVPVKAQVVMDASGYRASIAKAAGLHQGFSRFGVGAEYEVRTARCRQDELLLAVGNRYAPSGYAWVFPWGRERVRVGVGLLHADTHADPRKLVKLFLKEIRRFDVDLGEYELKELHYGLIPAGGLASSFAGEGIVAVGDAAGVATLVVGEGIRLSMESGRMAGEAAVHALRSMSKDMAALKDYERAFRTKYEFDLKVGHVINQRMARWTDEKWDDRVKTLRDLPPSILMKFLQSHFSARELGMWLIGRPHLWPRVVRWMVKGTLDVMRMK